MPVAAARQLIAALPKDALGNVVGDYSDVLSLERMMNGVDTE